MKRGTENIGMGMALSIPIMSRGIMVTLACHVRKSAPCNYPSDEYVLMQYPLELHSMQGSSRVHRALLIQLVALDCHCHNVMG